MKKDENKVQPEENDQPLPASDANRLRQGYDGQEALADKSSPYQGEERWGDSQPSDDIKPEITDWENIAKRALADLDNYRKQQEKMRGEMTQFMSFALLAKFLEVHDDLNRILTAVKSKNLDPERIPAEVLQCQMDVMKGIGAVLQKFDQVFASEGLTKIEAHPGEKFDPNYMEAISHEASEQFPDDQVIEQFEVGLKYQDKIIKPVKVRVGK